MDVGPVEKKNKKKQNYFRDALRPRIGSNDYFLRLHFRKFTLHKLTYRMSIYCFGDIHQPRKKESSSFVVEKNSFKTVRYQLRKRGET